MGGVGGRSGGTKARTISPPTGISTRRPRRPERLPLLDSLTGRLLLVLSYLSNWYSA